MFDVNEIRAQMTFGGQRPTNFQVQIQNPANAIADIKTSFMVRASTIPESTLGTIQVPYFGRKIKLAGNRVFGPWTVTVMNDEDFLVRNALEQWSNEINSHKENLTGFGTASPLLYKSQAQVTQFSKTGLPTRIYQFNGIWPSQVSQMEVDWNATDTIQEFQVVFEYDYWTISGGITGNAGITN